VIVGLLCTVPAWGDDSLHFKVKTRALLSGSAATELIDYCGRMRGTKDGQWQPSESDLDLLDATLAPLLAADLKSEGSTDEPAQYYRQYAAGTWEGHPVIYVNGFHERNLQSDQGASWLNKRWMTEPVVVEDGGPEYWCAVFIKDTGRFVTIKQEGRPKRTVVFHGYA
jgi:hypothetical protein